MVYNSPGTEAEGQWHPDIEDVLQGGRPGAISATEDVSDRTLSSTLPLFPYANLRSASSGWELDMIDWTESP